MKRSIAMLALLLLFVTGKSQTTFYKTIATGNLYGSNIQQTADGGYVIFGQEGGSQGYVAKTNTNGDTLWTRSYLNTSVKLGTQTSDGGYIIAGVKSGDCLFLKIDSLGAIQWEKSAGQAGTDMLNCIKQTSDGGYIGVGYGVFSFGAGSNDICVFKLDVNGNLQWSNVIGTSNWEKGYSVEETFDGGYALIASHITGSASTYLIKLNGAGTVQWSKSYSNATDFFGVSLITSGNGNFILLGNGAYGSASSNDFYLMKVDSLGNVLWSNLYTGTEGYAVRSLSETSTGNIIVSSSIGIGTEAKMNFTLVDGAGTFLWDRYSAMNDSSLFMSSVGMSASETSDGGFILGGHSQTPSAGAFIYFVKTDAAGLAGCLDSSSTLTVTPFIPTISTPTLTTWTGLTITTPSTTVSHISGVYTTFCTSVGIDESENKTQIIVYPNPSAGQFLFNEIERNSLIEIYSVTGELIFSKRVASDFEEINISEKATGIYFYRILNSDRSLQQGKLCKY